MMTSVNSSKQRVIVAIWTRTGENFALLSASKVLAFCRGSLIFFHSLARGVCCVCVEIAIGVWSFCGVLIIAVCIFQEPRDKRHLCTRNTISPDTLFAWFINRGNLCKFRELKILFTDKKPRTEYSKQWTGYGEQQRTHMKSTKSFCGVEYRRLVLICSASVWKVLLGGERRFATRRSSLKRSNDFVSCMLWGKFRWFIKRWDSVNKMQIQVSSE